MKKILFPMLINALVVLPSQAVPLENNYSSLTGSTASPIIASSALTTINSSSYPSNNGSTDFSIVPDDVQRVATQTNGTTIHPVLTRQNRAVVIKTVYKKIISQPQYLGGAQSAKIIHNASTSSTQQNNPQFLTPAQINAIKGQVSSIENDVITGIQQRQAAMAATTAVNTVGQNNQVSTADNDATEPPVTQAVSAANSMPIVNAVTTNGPVQQTNTGAVPPANRQLNSQQTRSSQATNSATPNTLNSTSDLSSLKSNAQNNADTNSSVGSGAGQSSAQLWNLQKVDIRTLIEEVSKNTGKNFLLDPRVEGKVTLISATPLNSSELFRVFLSILSTHGFAAVPINNNIYKIVPVTEANFQAVPEIPPGQMPNTEQYAVQVIPVQNANVTQLVTMLRPLLPVSSQIFAYVPTNSIIVTGTTNKVAQINQIIQSVDQPTANNITIVPLAHASAQDVVNTLKSLMTNSSQNMPGVPGVTAGSINLAADVGANAILISGPPNERERVKNLIKQLDVSSPVSQNAIGVVHLHYLNAKDLVKELSSLAGGIPAAPILGTPGSDLHTPAGNSPNSGNPNLGGYGAGNPNNPLTISLPGLPTPNASGSFTAVSATTTTQANQIFIQAENQTNSVIISAPPWQLDQLKSIIVQLDQRPPEVLVEAIIVDVSEQTMLNLGVSWGSTLPNGVTNMTDGFPSITGSGIGVGIVDFGRIRAVINYLAQDQQTNVLGTPSLVVLNNQKALIKVGKKVSFLTGQYATSSAQVTATPFTTTDQQDVALTLNVTPQISPDGSIRMVIKTGNQTLSATTTNGNPQVNEEQLNTTVIMNNDQILVLGGLISNDLENTDNYVPILGSLPLIGQLFHNHNNNVAKKNLMVFLHPVIIHDQASSDDVTGPKYSMMREMELVQAQRSNYFSPTDANPVMPQWKPLNLPAPFPRG